MFTAEFFKHNRKQLVAKLKNDGLIVITGNGIMQRNGDSGFDFRQESNFFYLTGLETPRVVLVIDTKTGEEWLILPQQTDAEQYFGGTHNIEDIIHRSGIEKVCTPKEGWDKFKSTQKQRRKIYTLPAPPLQLSRQEHLFTNPARRLLIQKLKRVSNLPVESLHLEMMQLRSIKQNAEIAVIQQAIAVTQLGLEAVLAQGAKLQYEYEVQAEIDHTFKRANSRHGFTPIIAAGKNATILHYQEGRAQIDSGAFVLLDIGAEVENYSADISRTYKLNKHFTDREQAVYQAVSYIHHAASELLRPGITWQEHMKAVDKITGEELKKLKLITTNKREHVRPYFPHAVSHSLGLDTHDVCDYSQPIEEGMVLTVEPGIYIPNEGIGIRIEDDILITKDGSRNLSKDIPYKA